MNALNGAYSDSADHHSERIRKIDKDFARRLDFKDTKFPVKIRDIHKIEKKNCISVFGYEIKEKYPIYVSKNTFKRHVDLLQIREGKMRNVLIKDFSVFMYHRTLHCGRKHFSRYCFQAFSTKETVKCHMNDSFKINAKQRVEMSKNGEYVKFKNYKREIKLPQMIYADFDIIVVPEYNRKQNPGEYLPPQMTKNTFSYKVL